MKQRQDYRTELVEENLENQCQRYHEESLHRDAHDVKRGESKEQALVAVLRVAIVTEIRVK